MNPLHRWSCITRSAGSSAYVEEIATPASFQFPQRHDPAPCPIRCLHSWQTRRSSKSRSRNISLSARASASLLAKPFWVNWCKRFSKVSISAPFMAGECGQHQRSGSSVTAMEESCFSNMAWEGTAKTVESSSGNSVTATAGTDETVRSLATAVSSVLTVPFWPFCEIAAFARYAQVIISPPS